MEKNILIISDDPAQAEDLSRALTEQMPRCSFEWRSEENEVLEAIENRFYSIAIIDISMNKYQLNAMEMADKIFEINPFATGILIRTFSKEESFSTLRAFSFKNPRIIGSVDRQWPATWTQELKQIIENYYLSFERDPSGINDALIQFYADAKNERDTYKKGVRFEHFMSLLFQSFGYKNVAKQVKDKSLNEVDLIIRNEIDDSFLSKFGKYILVECKNKPDTSVGKNDFIVFSSKLKNTNGLAELGIIATTGYISWNTYYEALRTSSGTRKIMFISNPEVERLIKASDRKEEFKKLIDSQLKDN